MNNVVTRSLSGAVYVVIIVGAILLGGVTFFILTSVFTLLGIHEFYTMAHTPDDDGKKYKNIEVIDMVAALLLTLAAVVGYYGWPEMIYCTALMVLAVYFLVRAVVSLTDKNPHAYREVAKSMLGVVYIGLPMFLLNVLYVCGGESTQWLVLLMFIMIWLNDTGAFCFGSTLGKRRLCERLSPKKSWEGFWGGLGCCVAFGAVCYYCFNYVGLNLMQWMILGALISVFATWGDLFESMLKRTVKVKDSGNIIPGHGGILDRIDSLLFVAPMTAIFYMSLIVFG